MTQGCRARIVSSCYLDVASSSGRSGWAGTTFHWSYWYGAPWWFIFLKTTYRIPGRYLCVPIAYTRMRPRSPLRRLNHSRQMYSFICTDPAHAAEWNPCCGCIIICTTCFSFKDRLYTNTELNFCLYLGTEYCAFLCLDKTCTTKVLPAQHLIGGRSGSG